MLVDMEAQVEQVVHMVQEVVVDIEAVQILLLRIHFMEVLVQMVQVENQVLTVVKEMIQKI
jgi:hypothetical protein